MDFGSIVAICTTIVATIAGVATIMSTIRYMKSENSKVLKEQSQVLLKIEKGQREGFNKLSEDNKKLSEDNVTIAKILEHIESNTIYEPQTKK
jgi:hypothetical protein